MAMDQETRASLALAPIMEEIMDGIRERLPEGTDFGLMVLAPGETRGRVIATTTDRDVVAHAVAMWVLDVLGPDPGEED